MLIQIDLSSMWSFSCCYFTEISAPNAANRLQSTMKYQIQKINTIRSVSIHIIGCTISQGSIVANVVKEVGGSVTSRAILSLLQAPGGVQALRSNRKYHIVSVCILRHKIKVHGIYFT